MSAKQSCLNLIRSCAAPAVRSRGASSGSVLRAYSSQSSNWISSSAKAPKQSLSTQSTGLRSVSRAGSVCTSSNLSSIRHFSATSASRHNHLEPPAPGQERKITFIEKDGNQVTCIVKDGDNILDIALENDLDMEGACGGSCACSTCHVIVEDENMFDKMDEPDDEENDMLDLAFGLTETSRLGCQVKMSPELDGLVVRLPAVTRNLQASDFADRG